MNEEEIRGYLNRIDELEQRLKREDKKTLQWLIFGYNECAKLLNEREQENQQLKEQQKEFIEYLEEPIRMIKQGNPINISEYTSAKLDTLEEVLLKYKEIIGDKDERI